MSTQNPLDAIRHAAVNRLCVDLDYNGTRRIVEPYSLRFTREGEVLLHARKHDSDEIRTYRMDKIEGVRVTDIHFRPLFTVEITAGGPLLVAPPR